MDIANGIDKDIQMEFDVPSLHREGRLPVLDLHLFIKDNVVKTSFFSKPISSPYTILFQSALSTKQKRNTLLQEGLRRLRNCSPDLDRFEVNDIMSRYMNMIRISGYDH